MIEEVISMLTLEDLPMLESHGFRAGFSGTTWFGQDRDGNVVQAIVDEETDRIYFVDYKSRQHVKLEEESIREKFKNVSV